jgi:hypothetical protein
MPRHKQVDIIAANILGIIKIVLGLYVDEQKSRKLELINRI